MAVVVITAAENYWIHPILVRSALKRNTRNEMIAREYKVSSVCVRRVVNRNDVTYYRTQ